MTDTQKLLADYVRNGSEPAFRELVTRYIDLVYSTAVRLVEGDTGLAQDVVQEVFVDLARMANRLAAATMLGGWLHRHTCFVAAKALRRERRRQHYERQAAEMNVPEHHAEPVFETIAPVLDEMINQLSAADRTAITLRFFEGLDLRAIGVALGSNEDAAQKRVTRAVEKLRGLLARRGITATSAGLAVMLAAQTVTAAPAGLAVSVSSAALAGAATGGGLTLTLLKLITMTKLKIALGAVVIAGIGTTVVIEYRTLTSLRDQNQALQQQVAQLTSQAKTGNPPTPLRQEPQEELDRLQRAANELRQQTNALANLQAENRQLRAATNEPETPPDPEEAEFKKQTEERNTQLRIWGLDFHVYAGKHDDRFPDTWEQVMSESQMRSGMKDPAEFAAYMDQLTNNFEIVYHGTTDGITDPGNTILFREKQARRSPKGEWIKVYGLADGSTQIHAEPDNSFDAYEKKHLAAAAK